MDKIDIIISTEAKPRRFVRKEALRWNAESHVFEFWNGEAWVTAYEDIISGGSTLEIEKHRVDPNAHPVATAAAPGFLSSNDKEKLDGITGIDSLGVLDPDPTEIFNITKA